MGDDSKEPIKTISEVQVVKGDILYSTDHNKNGDTLLQEPRKKCKRTIIIEPSMALFFMFHLSSYSIFIQYIYFATGEKYNLSSLLRPGSQGNVSEEGQCGPAMDRNNSVFILQQKVQAEAARFNVILELSALIPGMLTTLFFGTLVDRLGRKPGIFIPIIGMSFKVLVPIIQISLHLPLELLILGHVLDALMGGYGAYASSCYSFMADTISQENRAKRMTMAEVIFALCLAVTSITMGVVIKRAGFLWVFVIILIGHGVNMVYVLFLVPETMNATAKKSSVSPMYVIDSFKVIFARRPNKGRRLLMVFLVAWLISSFAIYPRYNLEHLYKLNYPFCWDSAQLGLFSGITTVVWSISETIVAMFFLKRLGEVWWTKVSLLSVILTFVVEAFATEDWMLMILPLTGIFAGIQPAVMKAILSRLVSSREQGGVFSVIHALDNVMYNLSGIMFNLIYTTTLHTFSGAVFLAMAFFVLLSFIVLCVFGVLDEKQRKAKTKLVEAVTRHTYSVHF